MLRAMRIAALLAGAACLLAFAPSAGAGGPGHTVSISTHQHGVFDDPEGFNPCTNNPVVWHVDGNLVEHVTYFPGGDEFWATFTETGTEIRWEERLDVYEDYVPDLKPWDVDPETRALADLCLVLFNANEFVYVD